MIIHDLIDNILKQLDIPFYDGMPLFDDEEPPLYAVYSVWEKPSFYGDGDIRAYNYTMSLHFFCNGANLAICEDLEIKTKKLLLKNKWRYIGSQTPSFGTSEPQERHVVYDYILTIESEEE